MKGHNRDNCFKLMHCDICRMKGHLKENCYKLIGYPADFKGKKKANAVMGGNSFSDFQQMQQAQAEFQQMQQGSNNMHISQQQRNNKSTIGPFFTQEHYNQILSMLSKTSLNEASANMEGSLHWEGEEDW
ncbi:uncharacterized protein LOC107806183 [Nicotiana tabacum]|uniref:Uncharacterized protein LOC107806183 n=1 Tax=Nicotiana tabacum TaxID=4097 RepID=A0A1S4BAA0_TOBAC|nr:PREDICTED: uncharacterized protein LOC107806183 [Nicotiana tabacum]